MVPDDDEIKKATRTLVRAFAIEFEHKAIRHAMKPRKKKETIASRAAEFAVNVKHQADWRVECSPAVVALLDRFCFASAAASGSTLAGVAPTWAGLGWARPGWTGCAGLGGGSLDWAGPGSAELG